MNRTFKVLALAAILLVVCLVGVVIAQTLKSEKQTAALTDEKTTLIERIQKSADHPLRIKEDADAPLKILSVGVKEISRDDYQKLTGKITELNSVYSVPEAALQNTSDKKITGVFFITRDLSTNKLKGMMMKDVSIGPGQTFNIKRGGAVKADPLTVAENDGTLRELTKESMANENYWLPFAGVDQLQVSVVVTFADGSKWSNRGSIN
ncbi:MAG TPA: hypothetical protein VGO50_02720 [Pyrinomonadaceae bacterium]|jgi:hypothetical protein|nr:hypothetical protein [Pyrinomonadaceae bacterium]